MKSRLSLLGKSICALSALTLLQPSFANTSSHSAKEDLLHFEKFSPLSRGKTKNSPDKKNDPTQPPLPNRKKVSIKEPTPPQLSPSSSKKNVFDMSLEELLQIKVKVPGAMTKVAPMEAPSAITTITQADIQHSAARNIYDLLEIYVPGAFWLNHEKGPSVGFRGIVENRNLKYLLLLNGRNINNKGHFGAKSELELWDLGDIEKIEVIRGPGSVTYGPGAVAGVISITTQKFDPEKGTEVSAIYVHPYESRGFSISQNYAFKEWDLHTYGSLISTKGDASDHYVANKNFGFDKIGQGVQANSEPLDYFGDYRNSPQIKLNFDLTHHTSWRVWAHYSQQGSYWASNEVKTNYNGVGVSQQGTQDKQFVLSVDHLKRLSSKLEMSSSLSFDSSDSQRTRENKNDPNDPDHPLNREVDFAEHEVLGRVLLNFDLAKEMELALGAEASWEEFGAGWGDDANKFRLGDAGVIVSDANSLSIRSGNQGSADRRGHEVFVGRGWESLTTALFSEFNSRLNQKSRLLLSGRLDKNTRTPWLFSPRIAYLFTPHAHHSLRLIASRSVRMNTAAERFIEKLSSQKADQETLESLEFLYSSKLSPHFNFNLSSYYNSVELVANQGDIDRTVSIGNLKLYGTEIELDYSTQVWSLRLSYSQTKQDKWKMASGVTNTSVSFSDYDKDTTHNTAGDFNLSGVGNDLNNVPNQIIKLIFGFVVSKKITLQVASRLFTDYQGGKDGLSVLAQALEGSAAESDFAQVRAKMQSEGVFSSNFFMDISLLYKMNANTTFQFYVQNVTGTGSNKRYPFVGGYTSVLPNKVRYIEEPLAVGLKLSHHFGK